MFPDNTCRFLVFDFDNHVKSAEKMTMQMIMKFGRRKF